jgi:outer membrane protein
MKNKFVITVAVFLFSLNINAQVYDIDKFLDLVKKNNKDILLAAKDLEIAETQDGMARSSAYPQVSASAGYNRNLKEAYMYVDFGNLFGPGLGASKFKVNYNNEFSASARVTQQIFNYSVFNAIKAAKQYAEFSNKVYDATLEGVINASKKAFYQTLLLKELWDLNKESEKNAFDNYQNVKKKFDVGLASELQMLQAEVRWQNIVPQVTQSERNYELALNSLKTLAGLKVNDDFQLSGSLDDVTKKPAEVEMADVLTNRSDYEVKLWERKLRESNVDVEFSSHFPTLSASFVYQFSALSDEFKLERRNNYLIAGLSLNIPIFSGWNTSSKVQKARIELAKTDLELSKFQDKISIEISNLKLKLDEAQKRISSAETTLSTAQKAFSIAEITADNGLSTQLELKDARLGLDQAKLNYFSAKYEYLDAYFDWELATGIAKY